MTDVQRSVREDLLEEVAGSAREFWSRKLTPGGDAGDTSLYDRDSGLIYILPKPSPDRPIENWGVLGPDYVAVVDSDGAVVSDNGIEPTVELQTHLRVYRARPEVSAIVHSHGEWSQIFSIMRWDIPTFTSETYFVGGMGPIRCAPSGGVATEEVAIEAVKALGTRAKAALLPSNGAKNSGNGTGTPCDTSPPTSAGSSASGSRRPRWPWRSSSEPLRRSWRSGAAAPP